MTARPKNDKWMADFMDAGKRYREFGFETKALAEAWELDARAALKRGLAVPSPESAKAKENGFSVSALVRYCAINHWAGKKSSERLVRNAELFAEFAGVSVEASKALSQQIVDDYVTHLRDESECSGSTINRRLSSVSILADYGVRLNKVDRMPRLQWQKEGEHRFRWFTEAETRIIFKTLRHWGLADMTEFFEFLCDTGCRVGEALKLEARDVLVSNSRARVTFWDTKNGKARAVILTKRAHLAVEGKVGKPFATIDRHRIRATWDRLRLELPWLSDAVVHTFRHTCASWLVQRGVDLLRVKEWMGHSAIQTTLRYAKLAPKHLEGLAEILEGSGQ